MTPSAASHHRTIEMVQHPREQPRHRPRSSQKPHAALHHIGLVETHRPSDFLNHRRNVAHRVVFGGRRSRRSSTPNNAPRSGVLERLGARSFEQWSQGVQRRTLRLGGVGQCRTSQDRTAPSCVFRIGLRRIGVNRVWRHRGHFHKRRCFSLSDWHSLGRRVVLRRSWAVGAPPWATGLARHRSEPHPGIPQVPNRPTVPA